MGRNVDRMFHYGGKPNKNEVGMSQRDTGPRGGASIQEYNETVEEHSALSHTWVESLAHGLDPYHVKCECQIRRWAYHQSNCSH